MLDGVLKVFLLFYYYLTLTDDDPLRVFSVKRRHLPATVGITSPVATLAILRPPSLVRDQNRKRGMAPVYGGVEG